jgi:hypothetical protein
MGLFSKLAKAGIAKKAFDEARKPRNQAKIRQFATRLSNKRTRRPR